MPSKPSIIDQLRKAVKASDESQVAISEATGVAQPHLSRFVRGDRGLSIEMADKLAKHFGWELKLVPTSRRK
jgi:plasmid maintenance system antidote protein VapI